MPWITVDQIVSEGTVKNAVNVDAIVRFGPRGTGSYIRLIDGNSIEVADSFEEMIGILQKLAGREN